MNLLQRLKAAFQADRQAPGASKWMQATTTVNQGGDSKRPDFDQRQAVAFYRSWIYAAASINAVAVASVPLRLYVRSNPSLKSLWSTRAPSRRTKAYLAGDLEQRPSRFAMRKAAEYGEGYEEVTEMHPVTKLLAKVNPYQNGYDATVLRVLYTELCGNAYLNVVKDKALGIPVELYPMPPQYVEIVPGEERFIEGYRYGVKSDSRKTFSPDEVLHFKRPNPSNLYYGLGKVEAAWGAALMNAAVHEMDLAFFENRGRPDYLLSVKSDAGPEEIARLTAEIEDKLRGKSRNGRFLTATADMDIKPLSFPPKDLSGRDEIVEEIAAVFGVPVSMLKANDPNLASATTGYAQWREMTVLPMLRMDEEVLNQSLLPMFGLEDDAFLSYDNPVQEDRRFELEERRTAVAGGWRTVNEARKEEGREPVDDEFADRLLFNGQPLGGPAAMPAPLPSPAPIPSASADAVQKADHVWGIDAEASVPQAKDALSDCVSEKIPKLLDEGYPQDQAVAIAYSMCSEGKSMDEAAASVGATVTKAISDIDTRPPQSVADNARRALDVRARKPESQRGMTAVGIARARDLMNRKPLSEDTVRRMLAYFERHESDKQGETWDEQGKGWQAWNGWGGDDGWAWARRKVEQFDREREKRAIRVSKSISAKCGCGCGCSDSADEGDEIEMTAELFAKMLEELDLEDDQEQKNCGVGSEGFEEGNTCGSGGGGGGGDSKPADKPAASKPKKPRAGAGKPAKGDAPSGGVAAPKEHNVKLPTNPRKLGIDEATSALRSMGYEMTSWKPSATGTTVTIRDSAGKESKLPVHEAVNLIYANSRDPKDNAAPALKPRKAFNGVSHKALWSESVLTKARKQDEPSEPEQRIASAVDKVLQRQVREALKAIRAGGAPSQELTVKIETLLMSAKWNREIVDAMRPYLETAIRDGLIVGQRTVSELAGAGPSFTAPNEDLDAYVRSESVRLSRQAAAGVNRYTAVRVSKLLGDGLQEGETIDQLADRVEEWAGSRGDPDRTTRSRAVMIARTEAQRASRSAEVEAWRSSGLVEGKSWVLAPDPCEFCQAMAQQFEQNSVAIGEPFLKQGTVLTGADGGSLALDYEDIDGPPLHPNCRCSLQPKLIDDYEAIRRELEAEINASEEAERNA